jgi:hypothetical protein
VTDLPINMNPLVAAPAGAVPLLATNPTWLSPELGNMYSLDPSMSDVPFEVIVQGTVESVVSAVT